MNHVRDTHGVNGFSAAQAIISAMITPALLIMASGSLIATALTRLARIVDRVRKLAETPGPTLSESLLVYQHRAVLAGRAIRLLVFAIVFLYWLVLPSHWTIGPATD